jgi:hypothetical protein
MAEEKTEFDNKLIPVLREGVEVVKMILFVKLKGYVQENYPALPRELQSRIVGAVLNDICGNLNPDPAFEQFAQEHRVRIEKIIAEIPSAFAELLIPLTDALRTSVLCDYQEGLGDTSALLAKAQERGLLLVDRDLPMPHRFIELVRRLGASYGLVVAPRAA